MSKHFETVADFISSRRKAATVGEGYIALDAPFVRIDGQYSADDLRLIVAALDKPKSSRVSR